jgi:branched-subunit amino acid ABC-type transport system permease component
VWTAVIVITVLVGFYVEWMCFDIADDSVAGMRRQSSVALGLDIREASVLAASFALWMQIEQVAVNFQPNHLHPFPDLSSKHNFELGGIDLRPDRIFVFFLTSALIAGLAIWLQHSRLGLGIRALSSSQAAAQVCGFNILRLRYMGTAVSCALCGLASCAVLSMDGQVTPMFGMWVLIKGLTCALLGGLGSVRGVLGGAILIGITEAHAQSLWGPIGRDAATWGLLLLALLFQAHSLKHKFSHAKKV